jgi:NAD+ kinase
VAQTASGRLREELKAAGLAVVGDGTFDPAKVDVVVLLGGDGFLMDSVRALGFPATPFLGVNFGSVGFLMNPPTVLSEMAGVLREGRLTEEVHPVLEARVRLLDGRDETLLAVNDFTLERSGGQGARLRVSVDGILLNEFSGDGLIVATSAGSTAYNLAAGGPVIHPLIPAMVVTPLYPHRAAPFHSLQFPVVLPLASSVDLVGYDVEKRAIRVLADGRPTEGITAVAVRDSGVRLRLLRLRSHEFISTLAKKFIGTGG